MVKEISGNENATLSGIIDKFGKDVGMHDTLKNGLKMLYDWSSKTSRHGQTGKLIKYEEPEARYMLFSCSAFIHYIISRIESS